MARALVLTEGAGARLADLVFVPLEKELLGAIKAPMPPFQRIFNQLAEIRAPEQLAATAVSTPRREQDSESMHPPLGERLANLGFTEIPSIEEIQNSAIDRVLSQEAVRELPARFDNEWCKKMNELVGAGR